MEEKRKNLGEAELEIMQAVWGIGQPCTSGNILKMIQSQRSWKLPTLMTSLQRLCDKGYLICDRSGGANIYCAVISEDEYRLSAGQTFLDRVYNNSIKNMVASLYDGNRLSEDDIQELKDFLRELEGDKWAQ